MPNVHISKVGILAFLAALTASGAQAQSNQVLIQSDDKTLSIEGELVTFDGDTYIIDHASFGRLQINVSPNVSCLGDACPASAVVGQQTLAVQTGSYGMNTLLPGLLAAYADHLDLQYSETAVSALEKQIALSTGDGSILKQFNLTYTPSEDERVRFAEQGNGLSLLPRRLSVDESALVGTDQETSIGQDALVFITNIENPIRNLSANEIVRIWSGATINWRDFGGADLPISVNGYAATDDSLKQLPREVFGNSASIVSGRATQLDSSKTMIASVIDNPGAIGVVRRSDLGDAPVSWLDLREVCGLLAPPTAFRIRNNGYPVSEHYFLYGRTAVSSDLQQWLESDNGQDVVSGLGLIDGRVSRMRLEDMGMMLVHNAAVEPDFSGPQFAGMMRDLRGADRLSISFRFEVGSSRLDGASIIAIDDLAQQIARGQFEGQDILLVGFADSSGNGVSNTALALDRAEAAYAQLLSRLDANLRDTVNVTTKSYGELMPLSCNDTADGRERNRRVEVWTRGSVAR